MLNPSRRALYPEFKLELTSEDLLEIGVFGGEYMTVCMNEFPKDWFKYVKTFP
jgi:hypothetical protein